MNIPKLYTHKGKQYNYPVWLNIYGGVIEPYDGSRELTPIKPEGFDFYCKRCWGNDVYAHIHKYVSNVKNYPHDCAVHNTIARKSWIFKTSWLVTGFCIWCDKEVQIVNKTIRKRAVR